MKSEQEMKGKQENFMNKYFPSSLKCVCVCVCVCVCEREREREVHFCSMCSVMVYCCKSCLSALCIYACNVHLHFKETMTDPVCSGWEGIVKETMQQIVRQKATR